MPVNASWGRERVNDWRPVTKLRCGFQPGLIVQEYLIQALKERYPQHPLVQINGGMSLGEKRESIDAFNDRAQFLVSTEAGGEGINLHQNCHVLVNYDLPWNPSRLVQRSGRLYRYGQTQRVIVFNLMADDGFDNRAIGLMLERVDRIAADLRPVSSEFQEGLHDEIIGALLERIDISSILAANRDLDLAHTDEEIDAAINRAKAAQSQQERLFADVEGYNPDSVVTFQKFGAADVITFLEGVLPYKGVEIRNRLYGGKALELELPHDMRGSYSEFPARATVVRVSADRQCTTLRHPNDIVRLAPATITAP